MKKPGQPSRKLNNCQYRISTLTPKLRRHRVCRKQKWQVTQIVKSNNPEKPKITNNFLLCFYKNYPYNKYFRPASVILLFSVQEALAGENKTMIQVSMTQNFSARITSWLIILTLSLMILSCGGGTDENQQAKGGLGEPVIIGPPTSGPGPSYSITLAWEAPTTNADGSPLTDLAGYKFYYGISSGVFTYESALITKPEFTTPLLPQGTYYFAVKAFDTHGNASAFSSTSGFCVNLDATPAECPK